MKEFQRRALIRIIIKARWNVQAAADLAGYERSQMSRLLREHRII